MFDAYSMPASDPYAYSEDPVSAAEQERRKFEAWMQALDRQRQQQGGGGGGGLIQSVMGGGGGGGYGGGGGDLTGMAGFM